MQAFSRGSKSADLWYNFNSRNQTLSIRNFNNLKSFADGFGTVDSGRKFQPSFIDSKDQVQRINRDIFAERNGHQRD